MKLVFAKRETSKNNSSLRNEGMTPVICYGGKEQPTPFSIETKSLQKVIISGEVVLDTDGDLKGKKVIIQDIQNHPVTDIPIHADFLFVDATHAIEYQVPVQIVGESPAIKVGNGEMILVLDKINVSALPQDIPESLDADISSLVEVGTHLLASDIKMPNGVTLVTSPDEIVVSIVGHEEQSDEEEGGEVDMENIEVEAKGKKKEEGEEDEE